MTVALDQQHGVRRAAKAAGIAYFLVIASSLIAMFVGPSTLVVQGDDAATFDNVMAHQTLFRGGALYEVLMYAGVVGLAVALYVVLSTVNRNLALLALLWRVVEAVLGCLTALCSLVILLLVREGGYAAHLDPAQQHALVGLLLGISAAVVPVVFVFLSLGTITNCYLFYVSRYIPRWLAGFGVVSFVLALAGGVLGLLLPAFPALLLGAPAILFELTIGVWLTFKPINLEEPAPA